MVELKEEKQQWKLENKVWKVSPNR